MEKKEIEEKTERVCVAVAMLRKKYNDENINLREWLKNDKNVYVGRRGRIFINGEIFHYKDSIWRNDFSVKEYGREKCLELFKKDIMGKIEKDKEMYNLDKLRGKKLGCFCKLNENCHIDVLINLIN